MTQELCRSICQHLRVKRIGIKSKITDDDFRSPKVRFIHPQQCQNSDLNTWAKRVENGVEYNWDASRSMFCAGNIPEKLRVAKFNCQNEIVVDLFAGIGYFTLPYLVHAKAKFVHACEWNTAAIEALSLNFKRNKIQEARYKIHHGDNRKTCPQDIADRVNLGLIPSSEISYETAVRALKQSTGGWLHIHGTINRFKDLDSGGRSRILNELREKSGDISFGENYKSKFSAVTFWAMETAFRILEIAKQRRLSENVEVIIDSVHKVKSYAPKIDHVVLDLRIKF